MKKSSIVWTVVIVIIIVIALIAWSSHTSYSTDNAAGTAPTTSTSATTPATGAGTAPATPVTQTSVPVAALVLNAATSQSRGNYLIAAANSMTLYTYGKDANGASNCSGACATAWPPYTVPVAASFSSSASVTGSISSITRADGTHQITYNGMPLYFYKGDTKVGDTNGQSVNNFSIAQP